MGVGRVQVEASRIQDADRRRWACKPARPALRKHLSRPLQVTTFWKWTQLGSACKACRGKVGSRRPPAGYIRGPRECLRRDRGELQQLDGDGSSYGCAVIASVSSASSSLSSPRCPLPHPRRRRDLPPPPPRSALGTSKKSSSMMLGLSSPPPLPSCSSTTPTCRPPFAVSTLPFATHGK